MGTLSRFRQVLSANLNTLLERAENPQKMLKALIRDMQDGLDEARQATVSLLTEEKRLRRHSEQCAQDQLQWRQRAEQALEQGDEAQARLALSHQQTAIQQQQELDQALRQAQQAKSRIEQDVAGLEARLAQAQARQRQWLQRGHTASTSWHPSAAERTLNSVSVRFERLETQLERLESRVEAYDLCPARAPMQEDAVVEAELDKLKAQMQAQARSK